MSTTRAAETIGRRGIGSLIESLRERGFAVSTSEAIDATQLVLVLSRKQPALNVEQLCSRLRPVFCKTREQQESFNAIFREWYRFAQPAPPAVREPFPVDQEPVRAGTPRRRWWIAIAALIVISAASAAIWLNRKPVVPTKIATSGPSSAGPSNGGVVDIREGNLFQERAAILGYFPRLRYNDELRPVWGWMLAALPLAALAGFSIPALVILRTRARRRSEPMFLERRALEEEARRIVPPLRPEIADKLARHLRGSPEGDFRLTRRPILDVRATIEKTLRNRGIPTPQYRHTHAPPSYLLLIDVANQRDPRGRLFYQWAERLQRERFEVEIALVRLHEGQPQFRRTSRGEYLPDDSGWIPLRRLPEPPFGQRLLLVSAGELLAEADGKWRAQASAARLHRWRQRAMFTPLEPRDWGLREEGIERAEHTADPGFLVLPLDENALSAWTDLLTTGQLSDVVLTEPQRFPGVLRRGKASDFNRDEHPPDPKTLEKLIAQLRIYLGDLGFTWLAALAIPPLVRWELTVLLGRDVIQRIATRERKDVDLVLSRNYRRLVRLPWLQRETMPNWLRMRLLAELPADTHEKLREVVEKLLGKLSPTPLDEGVALEFERPPGRDTTALARAASDDADPLYLGYMSGLTPRQLAMRAPKEWGKWLGKMRIPRTPGVRGYFALTADYARSWWARLMFRGGSPFSGLRRGPLIAALLLLVLAAACLWFVAAHDRYWWPESIDSWLFDEQAHAIAFQHAAAVRTASFSPDGLRVVTASDDGTARVWDAKTGRAITPPLRHPGAVVDAKWSPDGRVIATASGKVVYFWDSVRGTRNQSWSVGGTRVTDIRKFEFNRTGSRVVVVSGPTAFVLDLRTNQAIPLSHTGEVSAAKFALDDRMITASYRTARLWAPNGKLLFSLPHPSEVVDASFTRDGVVAMTTDYSGLTRLWVTRTGKPYAQPFGSKPGIVQANFNNSGRQVVTASADGAARIWSWVDQKPPLTLEHAGPVSSTSFSSDDQRVLTASSDGTARVWDAATGRAIGSQLRHGQPLTAASFSPDGTHIVTAGKDGTARIWTAVNDEPDVKPLRHKALLQSVAFDASGRRALTASDTADSAKVWDSVSGAQLSPKMAHPATVWSGVFNPSGDRVVTASDDGSAIIWDWRTGKPVAPPLRHANRVMGAEFSSDGRKVVTASGDGTARIWDSVTGSPANMPMRHREMVRSARFSPDDRYVVTASMDRTAQIWDAVTGRPIGKPLTHGDTVGHAAFSRDGRSVVTVSIDETARIWQVPSGAPRTPSLRHGGRVFYATFDPAGRVVVTVSEDSTARLWNASSGRLLHELRHDAPVFFAAFTPDGTRVATASDDHTSRLWEVTTGQLLAPPMRHRAEVFRVAFSRDGKRVITGTAFTRGTDPVLPNEYVAPPDSAQIWHVPPYPPPDAPSQSQALRRRASLALENVPREWLAGAIAIAAIGALLPALIVARRRKRQVETLARGGGR